jgi:DNA-binding MarR family transcriptional regulator
MSSNNTPSTIEQTFELLIKCMMQSKHQLIEIGSKYNLTAMQTMMLILLDNARPMNSFTKLFACDASNVTGLVDGLESKNLASRFPDKNDRRIKMVNLSSKGEEMRGKILDRLIKSNELYFKKLNKSEISQLHNILSKLAY